MVNADNGRPPTERTFGDDQKKSGAEQAKRPKETTAGASSQVSRCTTPPRLIGYKMRRPRFSPKVKRLAKIAGFRNVTEYLITDMPYGRWTCAGQRVVLHNRSYQPIWEILAYGEVRRADPREYVKKIVAERWFYHGLCPPWRDQTALLFCLQILEQHGVVDFLREREDSNDC
jgi:hypothetical protein